VIGLASSGLHSNGFSLVRRIVERSGCGLDETPAGFDRTLGQTLLEPTRIYAKAVLALLAELEVKALAHITGGGLLDNLPRTLPDGVGARLEAGWPVPPIFRWVAAQGPVEPGEMLRTFNMGLGMTAVVAGERADAALELLGAHGVEARVVGELVEVGRGDARVVVAGAV
jgi:phosphoribosylformylglycinamidine cyclo-ligase